MDRVFLKGRWEKDDPVEHVEVDNISFSSLDSGDELYMSVAESPCCSRSGNSELLSLKSEHIGEVYSTCDENSFLANEISQKLDNLLPTEKTGHGVDNELSDRSIESNSCLDELDDLCDLSLYSDFLEPLPKVIGDTPYWMPLQKNLRYLRQLDAEISTDLEKSNVCIYGTELAVAALEETRWLNNVSKDPELSRLVNQIDPLFPLAVNDPRLLNGGKRTGSRENDRSQQLRNGSLSPSANDSSVKETNGSSDEITSKVAKSPSWSFDPPAKRHHNSTFYVDPEPNIPVSVHEVHSMPSFVEGVDEILLKRKREPAWHHMSSLMLRRCFDLDPIRDFRLAAFMADVVDNLDQLLSLPPSCQGSSEVIVDGQKVVLRGSVTWAPPRDQWIFTLVKTENTKVQLEVQKHRCAGCGIRMETETAKRARFCEYFGKLFCPCCHQGSKSIIPARILQHWNFSEFPVCDHAFRFLTEAKDQTAIHLTTIAPHLISKVSVLKRVIALREKLSYMWEYINSCPEADETITKYGNLKTMFTSLERHLLMDRDVFSLSDLTRIHNKDLVSLLEPIAYYAKYHIENCMLCRLKSYVCWRCEDEKDHLFPFQLEKVHRCDACGGLSHERCETRARRRRGVSAEQCQNCVASIQRSARQRLANLAADENETLIQHD